MCATIYKKRVPISSFTPSSMLLLILALFPRPSAADPPSITASFCARFACGSWSTEEHAFRASVLSANLALAAASTTAEVSYGMTAFAHLTFAEFSSAYLGLRPPPPPPRSLRLRHLQAQRTRSRTPTPTPPRSRASGVASRTASGTATATRSGATGSATRSSAPTPAAPPPAAAGLVDWVALGRVAPVRDQGQCGSCWAFSAVACAESAIAIKENAAVVPLSEQELTSCSGSFGNAGCGGGWMDYAFSYMRANGLTTGACYSYASGGTGATGACLAATAPYNGCPRAASTYLAGSALGFADIAANDQKALLAKLKVQPISVALYAENTFQLYTGGVISTLLGSSSVNHAVLAVGYADASSGGPYRA